jgi:hypothetical protein
MIVSIPITKGVGQAFDLEEDLIREWFMRVDLEQARDTIKVCEVIIDARLAMQPKRKRRSDAGAKRATTTATEAAEQVLDLRELGK